VKSPRPASIRIFAWLLLGATVGGVALLLGSRVEMATGTSSGISAAAGRLLAIMWVLGYNLAFWVAIARRASNIARWLFAGLTLLGLVNQGLSWEVFVDEGPAFLAGTIIASLLQLGAMAVLFRSDASQWLRARGREPDLQRIFD